jgi:hypothetical protein
MELLLRQAKSIEDLSRASEKGDRFVGRRFGSYPVPWLADWTLLGSLTDDALTPTDPLRLAYELGAELGRYLDALDELERASPFDIDLTRLPDLNSLVGVIWTLPPAILERLPDIHWLVLCHFLISG